MRVKFMEMRAEQRKLHAQVKKLKAKNEPAHALLKFVVSQSAWIAELIL